MNKFKEILANIVAVPIAVVTLLSMGLWALLKTPFDWIHYRKSYFYRDMGEKFRLFLCDNPQYKLYNIIRERNLPIRYIPRNPGKPSESGWFLYKNTLIVHDLFVMTYDAKENHWLVGNTSPLMEHVLSEVEGLNQHLGRKECTQMFLPIMRSEIAKKDRKRAEGDFRFVVYDKGELGEILDAYIASHPNG